MQASRLAITFGTLAILCAGAIGLTGCGDDDGGDWDTVVAPTPTAPPDHHGPPHTLLRVGSSAPGSGALAVEEVPIAFVEESACLGGSGDHCDGGTVVYEGSSPGFNDLDADDPSQPIFILPTGAEVSIEITAIEAGAALLISGVLLDEVGEIAVVNTSPDLHNHPSWQRVAPGGDHPEDKQIRFRLHADGFASSDEITVTLQLYEDEDGGEHGR